MLGDRASGWWEKLVFCGKNRWRKTQIALGFQLRLACAKQTGELIYAENQGFISG